MAKNVADMIKSSNFAKIFLDRKNSVARGKATKIKKSY